MSTNGGRHPIGPFRDWLRPQLAVLELTYPPRNALSVLAKRLGTTGGQITKWLEEGELVQHDSVDLVLCHAGEPWLLREFWPHLYETEEMAA